VLVCTTIIESGIDVPTANTIFIADCDRFGLAELHQLRGRVGRYKHRAYCYLFLPQSRALTEVALQRLHAIESYSMLGAGFKIAVRDMEIRGVGNLIGPQQSGHVITVGYELYCRLLEEATRKLKHEPQLAPMQAHLDLETNGHLPPHYVASERRRMEVYRRLGSVVDEAAIDRVVADLKDAYGSPPPPTVMLIDLARLRIRLAQRAVRRLKLDGGDLVFSTRSLEALSEALASAPGSVRIVDTPSDEQDGTVYYRPKGRKKQGRDLIDEMLWLLPSIE
jgi:transcription-repair coupling factor (superfamily II helicase)